MKSASQVHRIGAATITRVDETRFALAPDRLFPAWTADDGRALEERFTTDSLDLTNARVPLHTHLWVVEIDGTTIVVDTGIGNGKARPFSALFDMLDNPVLERLEAAGFKREKIDYVLLTHLHVDHVGWNTRLDNGRWVPTFPKARYVFGKTEFDYWTETHAKTPVPPFGDSVLPVVEAKLAEIVRDDYAIGDHTRLLPTPGHTPGHVAFTFGRGKDDAVFSGDLMHSPLQTRYPELSAKFDVDQAQAASTRRNFMERYCDSDTLCCTAHFPSPSIGKIRRSGNGFSCEAI